MAQTKFSKNSWIIFYVKNRFYLNGSFLACTSTFRVFRCAHKKRIKKCLKHLILSAMMDIFNALKKRAIVQGSLFRLSFGGFYFSKSEQTRKVVFLKGAILAILVQKRKNFPNIALANKALSSVGLLVRSSCLGGPKCQRSWHDPSSCLGDWPRQVPYLCLHASLTRRTLVIYLVCSWYLMRSSDSHSVWIEISGEVIGQNGRCSPSYFCFVGSLRTSSWHRSSIHASSVVWCVAVHRV